MKIAELAMALCLAALSCYLMWKSGEAPSWNPSIARFDNIGFDDTGAPGSGFWPFWLSLIMLLSSLWVALNWWRSATPASRSSEPFMDYYALKMFVFIGGGLIGFLSAIQWLGFYAAISLFLIYYLRFIGSHGWKQTLLIAILTPVFCFFFFDVAMRIVLPKGLTEPLFLPLYSIFL